MKDPSRANGNLVCHVFWINTCGILSIVQSIFTLCESGGVYHGQGRLGLLQHRLREHGQVDALWNLDRSSIQVGDYDVQLKKVQIRMKKMLLLQKELVFVFFKRESAKNMLLTDDPNGNVLSARFFCTLQGMTPSCSEASASTWHPQRIQSKRHKHC